MVMPFCCCGVLHDPAIRSAHYPAPAPIQECKRGKTPAIRITLCLPQHLGELDTQAKPYIPDADTYNQVAPYSELTIDSYGSLNYSPQTRCLIGLCSRNLFLRGE